MLTQQEQEKAQEFDRKKKQEEAERIKAFELKNLERAKEAQLRQEAAMRRGELMHLTHAAVIGLSGTLEGGRQIPPAHIAERAIAIAQATLEEINEVLRVGEL